MPQHIRRPIRYSAVEAYFFCKWVENGYYLLIFPFKMPIKEKNTILYVAGGDFIDFPITYQQKHSNKQTNRIPEGQRDSKLDEAA